MNWFIPALVNSSVGSSCGTSGELATVRWPCVAKYWRNDARMALGCIGDMVPGAGGWGLGRDRDREQGTGNSGTGRTLVHATAATLRGNVASAIRRRRRPNRACASERARHRARSPGARARRRSGATAAGFWRSPRSRRSRLSSARSSSVATSTSSSAASRAWAMSASERPSARSFCRVRAGPAATNRRLEAGGGPRHPRFVEHAAVAEPREHRVDRRRGDLATRRSAGGAGAPRARAADSHCSASVNGSPRARRAGVRRAISRRSA